MQHQPKRGHQAILEYLITGIVVLKKYPSKMRFFLTIFHKLELLVI